MEADFWTRLSGLPPAVVLQHSGVAYLLVNAAHIVSLGVLLGAIVSLDLRLLGAFRRVPLAVVAPFLARMAGWGLALAILTGLWLFLVNAPDYVGNLAFQIKLGLLVLGLLNIGRIHTRRDWRRLGEDEAEAAPVLRWHAALSLGLWLGVVVAGRWIGFL